MPTVSPAAPRPVLRVELLEDRHLLHGFSAAAFQPHGGRHRAEARPAAERHDHSQEWGRRQVTIQYVVVTYARTTPQAAGPSANASGGGAGAPVDTAPPEAAGVPAPKATPASAAPAIALPTGVNFLAAEGRASGGPTAAYAPIDVDQEIRQPPIRLAFNPSYAAIRGGGEDVATPEPSPVEQTVIAPTPETPPASPPLHETPSAAPTLFAPETAGLIASTVATGFAALKRVFATPGGPEVDETVPWYWLGVSAWAAGAGVAYAAARRGRQRTLIEELS